MYLSHRRSIAEPELTINPTPFKGPFELEDDGSFSVCKTGYDVKGRSLSDTSSMRAECATIPDLSCIPPVESWEDDYGEVKGSSRGPERAEAAPVNKSDVVLGTGASFICSSFIDLSKPTLIPWRIEAVSLNDGSLQDILPARKQGSGSASVSAPSLTEGSSLESERAWLPETVPRVQTEHLCTFAHCRGIDDENIPRRLRSQSPEPLVLSICPPPGPSVPSESHDSDPLESRREHPEQHTTIPYYHDLSLETCGDWSQDPSSLPDLSDDDEYSSETESWSDTESVWMSDYSEGLPVFETGHPFTGVKSDIVRRALLAFESWSLRLGSGGTRERGADTICYGAGKTSDSRVDDTETGVWKGNLAADRKRARRSVEETEEDDDHGFPKKRSRPSKRSAGGIVSLACPFAKKDPLQYRSCYGYIMKQTKVVKQHLSRYHQLPIYCPRCKKKFDTEDERDVHASSTFCQPRHDITYEGVTRAQKEQLAQRVSPRMSLEDQWFTIFDILFPGHTPRPRSAFVNADLADELVAFQDMMYQAGPNIIVSTLNAHGIQLSTITNEEHDLAALQQVALAEAMQAIAQKWVESLLGGSGLPAGESNANLSSVAGDSCHRTNSSEQTGASSETLVECARPAGAGTTHVVASPYEQAPADGDSRATAAENDAPYALLNYGHDQMQTTLEGVAEDGDLDFALVDGLGLFGVGDLE